jgi:transcriptional regulator
MVFRRQLVELLSHEPRSASSLAREMGLRRGDIEDELRHALRSAGAAGLRVVVLAARCKDCDFTFSEDRLTKPSRCPACKGSRLHEPMLRLDPPGV